MSSIYDQKTVCADTHVLLKPVARLQTCLIKDVIKLKALQKTQPYEQPASLSQPSEEDDGPQWRGCLTHPLCPLGYHACMGPERSITTTMTMTMKRITMTMMKMGKRMNVKVRQKTL